MEWASIEMLENKKGKSSRKALLVFLFCCFFFLLGKSSPLILFLDLSLNGGPKLCYPFLGDPFGIFCCLRFIYWPLVQHPCILEKKFIKIPMVAWHNYDVQVLNPKHFLTGMMALFIWVGRLKCLIVHSMDLWSACLCCRYSWQSTTGTAGQVIQNLLWISKKYTLLILKPNQLQEPK